MPHSPIPVVLVHGIRISSTMWRPLARELERTRRVELVDLPGHGRRLDDRFTLDSAVEAVRDGIDRAGGRAVLVGHSLGGFTSMETISRHPERVAGFVGIGCSIRPRGLGVAFYLGVSRAMARNPQRAEKLSLKGFQLMLPPDVAAAMSAGGLAVQVMPDAVRGIAGVDPIGLLGSFRGPVRLVNGTRDPFRAEERKIARVLGDARVISVPRKNHLSVLGETRLIASIVEDTAASLDREQVA